MCIHHSIENIKPKTDFIIIIIINNIKQKTDIPNPYLVK